MAGRENPKLAGVLGFYALVCVCMCTQHPLFWLYVTQLGFDKLKSIRIRTIMFTGITTCYFISSMVLKCSGMWLWNMVLLMHLKTLLDFCSLWSPQSRDYLREYKYMCLGEKYFQGETPKILPAWYALPVDVIPKVVFCILSSCFRRLKSLPRISNLMR